MQESWRTAIARKKPSLPLRKILSLYEFPKTAVILDFGCGRGRDLQYLLLELGYDAYGYDPHFQPIKPSNAFDIVLSDLGSLRGGIPPHLCGGCRTPQELASYHGSM